MDGMIKLISSEYLPQGITGNISIHEDPAAFVKIASKYSADLFDFENLKPDKDHVGIHAVAIGDYERYGFNRNGDGFEKKANVTYHPTFVKYGHVFEHHKNKDSNAKLGIIKASAHNDVMGRIELVLHANKEKAADHLARFEKTGEIPFSMGCFTAGSEVLTAEGLVPIENVTAGRKVVTHLSRVKKVLAVQKRLSDHYYEVHLVGYGPLGTGITGNHEMYTARFEDLHPKGERGCKRWRRLHRKDLHKVLRWDVLDNVKPGDYLPVPVHNTITCEVPVTTARLFGFYMAEGSMTGFNGDTPGAVCITTSDDKQIVEELPDLAEWTSMTVTQHQLSEKCLVATCYGTSAAKFVMKSCGRAKNKRTPDIIWGADNVAKLNYLAAWFNGDGWQDTSGMHWSTCNKLHSIELLRLLGMIGIPGAITTISHPGNKLVKTESVEYVVNISNYYSELFCDISKAKFIPICGAPKTRTFISGDYLMIPVGAITRHDEETYVYNFSVEEDETYVIGAIAVHNCKVPGDWCSRCNTFRKTASDPNQCDHVKYALGRLNDDGSYNGVYNRKPKFFDFSFVTRPADRIAWDLQKVASSEILTSTALAEMEGLIVPEHIALDSDSAMRKVAVARKLLSAENHLKDIIANGPVDMFDCVALELSKCAYEKPISDEDIERLRALEPADVMYALAKHAVVLDPESYLKYVLGPEYGSIQEHVDEVKAAVKTACAELEAANQLYEICKDSIYDVDLESYDSGKATAMRKTAGMPLAGFSDDSLDARAICVSIEGQVKTAAEILQEKSCSVLAKQVARKYLSYKLAAADAINELSNNGLTDRQLTVLAAQNLLN